MPRSAIEGFRQWTAKRRRLLQGLLGLAVEGVAGCVPGGGLAVWSTRILGEFAKHGVDRLADASAAVPDVKPAGQALPAEQLDWLVSVSKSYAGLLDRLDSLVALQDKESDEDLRERVRKALSQHKELESEFKERAEEVRQHTLSLARIEDRLDDILHGQKGLAVDLRGIIDRIPRATQEWDAPKGSKSVKVSVNTDTPSGQTVLNSIGMKFSLIPAGKFIMGSPDSERERHPPEGPQHEVRITRSFYMGVYPVTQEEFATIMGNNPAHFNAGNGGGSNHPAEKVNWRDVIEFCRRLSNLPAERRSGWTYRLPTEAEWEYSCRAGTATVFHCGNSLSSGDANFDGSQPYRDAETGANLGKTTPVDSYLPNAFGLFDMHGNVWEWCSDWTVEWNEDNYYSISPKDDPQGLPHGQYRTIRGGSWCDPAKNCRSATRGSWSPGGRQNWLGFRVILVLSART